MTKFAETGVIIREDLTQALGALANNTAIAFSNGLKDTMEEDFRILKSEIWAHIDLLTAGQGEGLLLGIANGELSVAEIAETLNLDGPVDRNDRVAQEQATRWVKILGTYDMRDITAVSGKLRDKYGGFMIESKDRWTYSNPEGWQFFIFNDGIALATGANVRMVVTHYGVWVQ